MFCFVFLLAIKRPNQLVLKERLEIKFEFLFKFFVIKRKLYKISTTFFKKNSIYIIQ